MDTKLRADKSFKTLTDFSREILVCCPHCNKRATVISEFPNGTLPIPTLPTERVSKFRCNNCYKRLDETLWRGPIIISPVNSKCANCGTSLKDEKRLVTENQSKMKIKCKGCGQEKFYETKYELAYANSKQATDPYFGLPLWLQLPFDNNIFWAYNFEHLSYLKEYVAAKLRDVASFSKYSLAWKLPNFIKVAKNRDGILKLISRLEKKT